MTYDNPSDRLPSLLFHNPSTTFRSRQHQQRHCTLPLVIIDPPSFLSLLFHRYFTISFGDREGSENSNAAARTCAKIRYFSCGPFSYRACMCVLIDVYAQSLLYMFSGLHKIIPHDSPDKFHLPPKLFASPIQNGHSPALVRTPSHPMGHSEIHTL